MRLTPRSIEKPDDWLAIWLAISLAGGIGLGILASLLTGDLVSGLGVALGSFAVAAGPGVLSPTFARSGAQRWNRVARGVGRRLSRALVAVIFYFVIWPTGLAGARLHLEGFSDGSGWANRPAEAASRAGFVRWAVKRRGAWVIFLVPFLALLRSFEARVEGPAPSGIYTLF